MKFTKQDERAIKRLRAYQKHWGWLRWFILGVGCYMFGRLYVVISSYKAMFDELPLEIVALHSSFYVPYILVSLIAASAFIMLPLLNWRGSDKDRLLLRVIDHIIETEENNSSEPGR